MRTGLYFISTGSVLTYVSFPVATIVQDPDSTDSQFWPPSPVIICTDPDSDPDPSIIKQTN